MYTTNPKRHASGAVSISATQHIHSGNGKFWNNNKKALEDDSMSCQTELAHTFLWQRLTPMHSDWPTECKKIY